MAGPSTSDAQLRAEIEKLKKSVEALESFITVVQGGEVTIGDSQRGIVVKKNGDVHIHANNFEIVASGRASIKSSGNLVLKGKKVVDI